MISETQPVNVPPVSATDLRNNWTPCLQATCNRGTCQPINRYGRPAAVLVLTWFYRAGVLIRPDATSLYRMPSNDGRRMAAELLTKVAEHAHHIVITVDGYDVAVFVPAPWADAVVPTLTNRRP